LGSIAGSYPIEALPSGPSPMPMPDRVASR
jgi:hypothetical protein